MFNLTMIDQLNSVSQSNNSTSTSAGEAVFKHPAINSIAIGVNSIITNINGSLFSKSSNDLLNEKSYKDSSSINTESIDLQVPGSHVPFKECSKEEKYCSVTRIEYVTNEVKKKKFWATERRCSSNCRKGCIILGEGKLEKN